MSVHVYPADNGGCGCYRLQWPAEALISQGFPVNLFPYGHPDQDLRTSFNSRDEPVSVELNADVVILQRPLNKTLVDLIPVIQSQGTKVIVEVDDDFEAISAANMAFNRVHPRLNPQFNWQHLKRACQLADWVTVTTEALARRYGRHGRCTIIPNYVPSWYLDIPHEVDMSIGWSGAVETHPHDLQQTRGLIARLCLDHDIPFVVVGDGNKVGVQLGFPNRYEIHASGWQPLDKYPQYLAQIGVGIVPLELTLFNEAKSWLKGLEMASLGVPFVASPTEPYSHLASYGIGDLAYGKDWKHKVRTLALDKEYAWQQGAASRSLVKQHGLTIEDQTSQWWTVWNQWGTAGLPKSSCSTQETDESGKGPEEPSSTSVSPTTTSGPA